MACNVATVNWFIVSLSFLSSVALGWTLTAHSLVEVENTQATVPEFTTSETIIRARPHVKNHEGLMAQCKYFPTKNLQELCRKIAENPVIASMRDTGMVHGNLKRYRISTTPLTKSGLHGHGQETESRCPDYSMPDTRERSLSPWELTPNFDQHRYPQWIPEAKCLCKGCIDMTTGTENTRFISRLIKVKVRFLRMNTTSSTSTFRHCTDETCYPSDEDVFVGCYCAMPGGFLGV